jgi:hypothetical protein
MEWGRSEVAIKVQNFFLTYFFVTILNQSIIINCFFLCYSQKSQPTINWFFLLKNLSNNTVKNLLALYLESRKSTITVEHLLCRGNRSRVFCHTTKLVFDIYFPNEQDDRGRVSALLLAVYRLVFLIVNFRS